MLKFFKEKSFWLREAVVHLVVRVGPSALYFACNKSNWVRIWILYFYLGFYICFPTNSIYDHSITGLGFICNFWAGLGSRTINLWTGMTRLRLDWIRSNPNSYGFLHEQIGKKSVLVRIEMEMDGSKNQFLTCLI